jgi:hypothetical protein
MIVSGEARLSPVSHAAKSCAAAAAEVRRKNFFFEKKKQKTFDHFGFGPSG